MNDNGANNNNVPVVSTYPLEGEEYEMLAPAISETNALSVLADYIGDTEDSDYPMDDEVIIDGVFREIEEEVYGSVEVEDRVDQVSIASNVVFVDENGFLVKNYEDFNWTGTLDYIPTQLDYAAAMVENKVVITPRFAATIKLNSITYEEFLTRAEELFARVGVAMPAFIDVHRKDSKELELHGQLCAIELATSVKGVDVVSEELISIMQASPCGYVLVKLGERDNSDDELKAPIAFSCMTQFTRRVVKMDAPVDYLYRIPHTLVGDYNGKQLLYIYMMALDRYNCFFVHNNHIYLPPYSRHCGENVLVPLYKELALCYFGVGSRDRLYSSISVMCNVEDINQPAASYLCPIEYLNSVGQPELKDYISKLFTLKRPVEKDSQNLKQLRKAKSIQELLECITLFEAGEQYPISTIGLFASSMQEVPMFKQLAGCTDADLLYQLVQEMVQVLCKKEPKALASILMAHRSTLTPEQKEQAIKAIKKSI